MAEMARRRLRRAPKSRNARVSSVVTPSTNVACADRECQEGQPFERPRREFEFEFGKTFDEVRNANAGLQFGERCTESSSATRATVLPGPS